MIILLDNYDSFTWNLWHFLQELGSEVKIVKNDEMTSQIVELNDESRVNEIAGLISGAKITETAKKVASDLLQN